MNTDLFKLIRLGLGLEREGDDKICLDEKEWEFVFHQLQEQALIGIGFAGVQRLPKECVPPRKLTLQWFGISEQIKQRNVILDNAVIELCKKLNDDGWRFCILNEIMRSGNFGNASNGNISRNTKWQRFTSKVKRNLSFIMKYPAEVLWYIPFAAYETIAYKILHR